MGKVDTKVYLRSPHLHRPIASKTACPHKHIPHPDLSDARIEDVVPLKRIEFPLIHRVAWQTESEKFNIIRGRVSRVEQAFASPQPV